MPDFIWKQGDTGPALEDTLSGFAPLQGAAIALRLRSLTSAALVTLTGTASIVNASSGTVQFVPSTADTDNPPGHYIAEWVVTYANGQVQTFPTDGYIWGRIEPTAASVTQAIVSLEEIKEYLGVTAPDRTRDAQLSNLASAVVPLIEQQVGPILPRVYEEWHDGGSNLIQLLRAPSVAFETTPVLQLIAASEYRGPIEYPLALVASPVFGSIYSAMVNADNGTITRRSAGGATIAFMPGRESVHVWYQTGQQTVPPNIQRAALEAVRIGYRWPQQIGRGSMSPADQQEVGAALQAELTRVIRIWTQPMRRAPSFA